MKNIILSLAASVLFFSACNSGTKSADRPSVEHTATPSTDTAASKAGQPGLTKIIDVYLQMKNALTRDNDKDAAAAGLNLARAISSIEATSLPPGQAKVFSDIADDVKEHAEHIGANAGNIKHQREHFETLSQDIYDLVKAGVSTSTKLYFDHCPMYNNNKGANWLSETKKISNPYLGQSMPDCGTVKEELNN